MLQVSIENHRQTFFYRILKIKVHLAFENNNKKVVLDGIIFICVNND